MTNKSASAVQIAAIFAIVIIIVVEIKLGRNYATWAPVLTAIVGYALPGPVQWSRRKSNSMIHMDPEFENKDDDDEAKTPVKSKLKRAADFLLVIWPSLLLLAATAIWVGVDPSSTPAAAAAAAATDECGTAREAAAPFDCARNQNICAKRNNSDLGIFVNNASMQLPQTAWSNLMFFSVAAAKRMTNDDCEHRMPLTYGDNFVRACKNRIVLHWNGHAHSFNQTEWSRLMRVAFLEQAITLACPAI